jgi:hypothetical protein
MQIYNKGYKNQNFIIDVFGSNTWGFSVTAYVNE